MPDQFVVAVENALGHHLQLVLTEQPESAQEILADLSANKSGRASVAALSISNCRRQATGVRRRTAAGRKACRQTVCSRPDCPRDERDPGRSVGGTAFASACWAGRSSRPILATATAQIQNGHAGLRFCHAERRFAEPPRHLHRRLSERQRQSGKAPGFHSRPQKSDRRIAGATWRNCRSSVDEASRKRGALLSEQTELQASLQQAQTELREQEVAIATREGEFNALQNSSAPAAPEN